MTRSRIDSDAMIGAVLLICATFTLGALCGAAAMLWVLQ
jgi:hypothetical protein